MQAVVQLIATIIHGIALDDLVDPVNGRQGIELLENWAQEIVGMSGNMFCSDFTTTHLENYGNLEKLADFLKCDRPQYLGQWA